MTTATVTLCLVANEAFALGAEATLRSAAAVTTAPVTAYVVDVNLGPATRERLAGVGVEVIWVELDDSQREMLSSFYADERFSHWAAYGRVLLDDFLPDLDRVIYLDTDTVVLCDLSELAQHDIGGRTVAAVDDPWVAGLHARQVLGRDRSRPLQVPRYFNSGVMVIDRRRWHTQKVGDRIIALLAERRPFVYYDQDPLNQVLAGDWASLPEEWNRLVPQPGAEAAASSAVARAGGVDRERLLDGARIVHFIGSRKPWMLSSALEPTLAKVFWSQLTPESAKRSGCR